MASLIVRSLKTENHDGSEEGMMNTRSYQNVSKHYSVSDVPTGSFRGPDNSKNVPLLHSEITSDGVRFVNPGKMTLCQLVPEHNAAVRITETQSAW